MRSSLLLSLLSTTALCAQDPAFPAKLSAALVAQMDLEALFAAALPPAAESLWTLIPWRHSLTDALAEAKERKLPIYVFVNDGDVGSGRC
jgi:hypothetical protein